MTIGKTLEIHPIDKARRTKLLISLSLRGTARVLYRNISIKSKRQVADESSWTQKWIDDKMKRLDNGTGLSLNPSTKGYEMVTLVCIRRVMCGKGRAGSSRSDGSKLSKKN